MIPCPHHRASNTFLATNERGLFEKQHSADRPIGSTGEANFASSADGVPAKVSRISFSPAINFETSAVVIHGIGLR
jgi:hypothetical protein